MSPYECTELVVRTKQPGLELEARESVLRAEYAEAGRPRGVARTSAAARRARRRPHAVPALRRGRVVVAHRRSDAQGVEDGRARGLRRRQRRPGRAAPLPRARPLLAPADRRRRNERGARDQTFTTSSSSARGRRVRCSRRGSRSIPDGRCCCSKPDPTTRRRAHRPACSSPNFFDGGHGAGPASGRTSSRPAPPGRPRRCTSAGAAPADRRRSTRWARSAARSTTTNAGPTSSGAPGGAGPRCSTRSSRVEDDVDYGGDGLHGKGGPIPLSRGPVRRRCRRSTAPCAPRDRRSRVPDVRRLPRARRDRA